MNRVRFSIACALLLCVNAVAQTPQGEGAIKQVRQVMGGEDGGINFVFSEMEVARETIQGAPYTATSITESTQVLADGNHIVNKRTAFVARDGQGRVRREENIGPAGLQGEGRKMVFINDPTNKTDYILTPDEKAARVVKRSESGNAMFLEFKKKQEIGIVNEKKPEVVIERRHEAPGELKRETLPSQVIEGVNCEGERVTRIIPAGKIGNEKPIEIVSETWTSPELHVMVMRKRSDPRTGETVYRLTDIHRGEPDPALFQVPSNYKSNSKIESSPSRD